MKRITITNAKNISQNLEVPNNITVRELHEKYCKAIGRNLGIYEYAFNGVILEDYNRLCDYDIEDGDIINYFGDSGTHLCPYGCGRQIPNEYKGCSELLKDQPNYFG